MFCICGSSSRSHFWVRSPATTSASGLAGGSHPRLAAGKRFLFLTPERFLKAEIYFAKYGAATVFFGRWVALLRIAAGPAAGAAGMRWSKFLAANAAGAALWATAIGIVGYMAGPAWQALQRWLGRGAWALAGVVVVAFVAWKVLGWLRKKPEVKSPNGAIENSHGREPLENGPREQSP